MLSPGLHKSPLATLEAGTETANKVPTISGGETLCMQARFLHVLEAYAFIIPYSLFSIHLYCLSS